MDLYDLIEKSAEEGLKIQKKDGSMPCGENGPWNDEETPVRNTAHWSITFFKAHEISGEEKFLEAAENAVKYILDNKEIRPYGFTYHCRHSDVKDQCNGLIGQAWVIEALAKAYKRTNDEKYRERGIEVFNLHPFNKNLGLWKTVEINGDINSFDETFNHQLWFAAAGSMLEEKEIDQKIKCFMDNIRINLHVLDSGIIYHKIDRGVRPQDFAKSISDLDSREIFVDEIKKRIARKRGYRTEESYLNNSIGYHSFNTYGLCILHNHAQKHGFWQSETFENIIDCITLESYMDKLEKNTYSFTYNPTGIENAYTLYKFRSDEKMELNYLQRQLSKTFDYKNNLMNKNTSDPHTLSARFYEASRLSNYKIRE